VKNVEEEAGPILASTLVSFPFRLEEGRSKKGGEGGGGGPKSCQRRLSLTENFGKTQKGGELDVCGSIGGENSSEGSGRGKEERTSNFNRAGAGTA